MPAGRFTPTAEQPRRRRRPQQAQAPSPEDLRPSQPPRTAPPPPQRQQAPSPEDVRQPRPRFQQPNAPGPSSGPPLPVLQNLGFHGSIFDFSQRLAHVVEAHESRFGYRPSPGFALNLATSAVADIGKLFDATPGSGRVARLQPAADKAPRDLFLTRDETGTLVPRSPLLQRIIDRAQHVTLTPKQQTQIARSNYPTAVQAQAIGILPLSSVDQTSVEQAIERLDKYIGAGSIQVTENGLDISTFTKELSTFRREHPSGVASPMEGPKVSAAFEKAAPIISAVKTIKQAQAELNDRMGTDLPVNGHFNDDWLKAVSNWMHSASYFRQVAKYQSQGAGFGDDYGAFYKAWKAKQSAVQKHGWAQWFISAQPLHVFAHGGGFGIASGVWDEIVRPKDLNASTPLHLLTRTAGLGFAEVGGGLNQTKAYAAAGNALSQAVAVHGLSGKTLDEARGNVRRALKANPSWLRVVYPQLSEHPKGALGVIDQATNLAVDLLLLRKPAFTGERVAAGDILAARRSSYLRASAKWAYGDLAERGALGRAASRFEGGRGAEQLVAWAAKRIKSGKMSEAEFTDHVAELYAKGETTLQVGGRTVTIQGPLLDTLRTKALPTPGVAGRSWLRSKNAMRETLDALDGRLRRSIVPGTDNAATFVSGIRAEIQHAAPRSARHFYDPRLPERVHDFVIKHFGDAELANKWESELVRYRATENNPAIQKLEQKLRNKYAQKYPVGRDTVTEEVFKPTLETEAPSVFRFPSGGERKVLSPWDGLLNAVQKTNRALTTAAVVHSRIILSGFPIPGGGLSLAWKHVVGDTLRRMTAEGTDGFIIGKSAKMRRAEKEIQALADHDPGVSRQLGTYVERAKNSEVRWLLNRGGNVEKESFRTGAHFERGRYMETSGGYLRRLVDDKALSAYEAARESDLTPLVKLVLHDKDYRGMWKAARQNVPDLSAEEFAQKIWDRYVEVESAGHNAGLADPFELARKVVHDNRLKGGTDAALGRMIAENRWDFPVKSGYVEQVGSFDQASGWWIGKVMTANKWNRGQLAKRSMFRAYSELRDAGWDERAALQTAMSVGERVTIHHMLDFSNRLGVEQQLRWLSYFATKHRLYWKWVTGTILRRPGAALAIGDIEQHLDGHGNLQFDVAGHKLAIPAARLVWVPGREYSEVSPVALGAYGFVTGGPQGALNAAKGTFGNIFTRSDTALNLLAKATSMQAGKLPTTYAAALHNLDEQTRSRVARALNEYQTSYFHDHGHYDSEAHAVKHVLLVQGGEELWRANLPLPILFGGLVPQENKGRELLRKYMLLTDPAKRRRFLDDNPDLQLYFGVYKDPAVYLHNRDFWRSYNSARDRFRAQRQAVYERAKQEGFTPKLREQTRKISEQFGEDFNRLLLQDAAESGKLTEEGRQLLADPKADLAKVDAEKYIAEKGSWARQILVDPLIDPQAVIHKQFPRISPKELAEGVPGFAVKQARAELKLLRDPRYQQTFEAAGEEAQSEIKTRIRELLQFVSDFQGYPVDALGKVQRAYQANYVNTYWSESEKRYSQIKALPRDKQDVAYAEYRAWRDEQDNPVTVKGIKFPSPVRMAWASLDPQTRRERLAKLAGASWEHITAYEKQLLGRETDKKISRGWLALATYKAALLGHITVPGMKPLPVGERRISHEYEVALAKYVEKIGDDGKPVPGFYKDYLFAQKPAYERLPLLAPIKESPNKRYWHDVLTAAAGYGKYLKADSGYSKSAIRDTWRAYVDSAVAPYLRDHPRFAREVAMYRTTQGPKAPTRRDAVSMATDVVYSLINR